MYKIKIELGFSAAHNLRGYKGKCEELHGHNWKVEVALGSKGLDKTGMVMDFTFLKAKLNKILERMDHKYLNNIPYFKEVYPVRKRGKKVKFSNGVNPTSENIAKYIYDNLASTLSRCNAKDSKILEVTVWESDKARATYYEE